MLTKQTIVLIVLAANIPLSLIWAKLICGSWRQFWDDVAYVFTPDWVSLFRGRLLADWAGTIRILLWFVVTSAFILAEFYALHASGTIHMEFFDELAAIMRKQQ